MPNSPRPKEALRLLRAELDAELGAERAPLTRLTTSDAWRAYLRFGRNRFDTVGTADGDGLLFQFGTYAFTGRPMFTLDLARQFAVVDAGGELGHYVQVHCELRYEPTPALEGLGSFDSWFFHDVDGDFDGWADAMSGRLLPLLNTAPGEVELYEDRL